MLIDETDVTSYAFYLVNTQVDNVNYRQYNITHLGSNGSLVGDITCAFAKVGAQGPAANTDLAIGTTANTSLEVTSSTGNNVTLPQAVASTTAGLLSGDDKAKLDGIAQSAGPPHTIQEEGSDLTQRGKLNFIGSNVTAADNSGNDATDITISDTDLTIGNLTDTSVNINNSGGTGVTIPQAVASTSAGLLSGTDKATLDALESRHIIENDGTPLTSRPTIDFQGAGVTVSDDAGNNQTVVTISGGGGGGSAIEVEDDGVSLTTGVTKLNFAGSGVVLTEPVADEVLVTIAGGSGGTGGALVPVGELVAVGGESILEFTGLSGTNKFYKIQAVVQGSANDYIDIVFNGDDTASNYASLLVFDTRSSTTRDWHPSDNHIGFSYSNGFCHLDVEVQRAPDDCAHWYGDGMYLNSGVGDDPSMFTVVGNREPTTTEITSIGLKPATGTFIAGSEFRLYEYDPSATGSSGGGSSTEAVSFASLILDAQLSADASVGVGTVDFDVVNIGSSNYSSGVYTFDLDFEGFVIVNATNTTSSRVAYEVRLDGTRIVRADEQTGGGDGPHALSTLFFTATAGQTLVVHNLVSTSWRGGSDGETYFQLIRTTDTTSDTLTLNSTTSSLTIDNTYINEVIESESASAINITVDDAHGFSKGQWVQFNQIGAGQISFVASGSQNLQAADASNKTRVQYSSAMLLYRDNNNWLLTGDITT